MHRKSSIHEQILPIAYTPSILPESYNNIVWGRKRSQIQMVAEENVKKESGHSQDIRKMNQMIIICDDLLKMFDELIIPAARLLDNVETKIQDYQLLQTERNENMKTEYIPSVSKRKRTKPTKYFQSVKKCSETNLSITTQKKTEEISRLAQYACPTFLEQDRIEWNENEQYKQYQKHQAEEEAETDEEMIEYGVKIASKTVRTATKAFLSRDWSLSSRMKYYRLSIKRLQTVNRKKRR